jgi:hypothetical protein
VERHELLKHLHRLLRPRSYFEIGVNRGASLELSRAPSVAVDPFFKVIRELRCDVHLVRATSDEFFARKHPLAHLDEPVVDLAFIDGMHLSEYAFRDFINTERFTHAGTVLVIDDMLPRDVPEAARDRAGAGLLGAAWTGDVYKVNDTLRTLRPDLVCIEVDTEPTGTVVVFLPDPTSQVLHEAYDDVVQQYVTPDPQDVPREVLERTRAWAPEKVVEAPVWKAIRQARGLPDGEARQKIRAALERSGLLDSPVSARG